MYQISIPVTVSIHWHGQKYPKKLDPVHSSEFKFPAQTGW